MRTAWVLFLVAWTSILALAQSGAPNPVKPQFSITISTETPVVKSGSAISIKVRLTNTSGHDISITRAFFEGADASYKQEVRDEKGNLSSRERSGPEVATVSGHWARHTLKPGESTNSVTSVSPEYDVSRVGQYVIQLSRAISDDPKDGVVKSNPITITVTP